MMPRSVFRWFAIQQSPNIRRTGFSAAAKRLGAGRYHIPCALPFPLSPGLSAAPELQAVPAAIDPVVRSAQDGDAAAFARLYDQYADRIFALAMGLTGDRQMAEEVVQDTFVRTWERLASFRGECAFPTWLHRVAVNVLLAGERSRKRRALRVAIAADLAGAKDGTSPTLDGPTPPRDPGLAVDLEAAITRLPAGARAVFVLHDIGGYAHAEIAAQLGIAEGTSKAHLFRARRLLRGMLDP